MTDLKVAVRALGKTPFITAVAVLSLALGIGANAAIFSLFERMLLESLPVVEPERLVNLSAPGPKSGSVSCGLAGDCDEIFSYPMFRDLQSGETGLQGLAAHKGFGANLALEGETVSGAGLLVSGSYFQVLGVRPALGRLLGPVDDRDPGEQFVVVLGHGYWQARLGGEPEVLNRTLIVNGHPMTIVGVAPRGFTGTTLGARPDVFVPITMRGLMEPGFDDLDNRRAYWAYLFGRLEAGTTLEQAAARINTLYSAIIRDVEVPLQEGMSAPTRERFRDKQVVLSAGHRGQSSLHEQTRTPLLLLMAITGTVLLIACANIANLLLVRGASRNREMAIRSSLGADRGRLLRQLLTESCLLALVGGVTGLLVGHWLLGLVTAMLPTDSSLATGVGIDGSVALFAAVVTIATGLLFGIYPALATTRTEPAAVLRAVSGRASGGRAAIRFRNAMVIGQLALSMALLVAAGLFVKSLINVSRVDLGLETDGIVAFGLSPELNGYEPERSRALFEGVEDALAATPGVRSVAAGMVPILSNNNWSSDVSVEGFESGPDIDSNASLDKVGPGYFGTLGIPLLAGREFSRADTVDSSRVAIVNEAFVAKFGLDGRRIVGKRMAIGGTDELDTEIVGVVRDATYSDVKRDKPPLFFTPYRQDETIGRIVFYVRTAGDPEPVLRAVPAVIERLAPNLPVQGLKTLDQQIRDNTYQDRLITVLSAAFAVLATLLAAVGLYGVLAYTVSQRTREIGVRIALGADGRRVRGMVLRQVGRLLLVGTGIGLVAGLLLGRAAGSLLYGLEGHDPAVVIVVTVLLAGIALGAGYLPALRASRIEPMRALTRE